MRNLTLIYIVLLTFIWGNISAKAPDRPHGSGRQHNVVHYRAECANSESQIDQEINNVRARLLGGGDCWWNLSEGSYFVPKVDVASGQRPVSSLFAGSVWLGGIDPGNNLKLACQTYRSDGKNDFWNGPLTNEGLTEVSTCKNWDKHFRVTGDEIREHLGNILAGNISPDLIPKGVKGWPAQGNTLFPDVWGFDLPNNIQGLAGFYDADGDNLYDPLKGDYPSIDIRGCPNDRYPDEMIFWIYNDQGAGATHARTNGKPIQMEVQVQAFGYTTSDELNDMTFQRYKLINRATESIDSMFFAMWCDPDLGCSEDDNVGCDTARNLMYVYNADKLDGISGCACGDAATYCDKVPIIGIDYFRGPLRQIERGDTVAEIEVGLSSFTYWNRGVSNPPAGTLDPGQDIEYYNYLTGTWRDGTPFTFGGSAYAPNDPTAVPVKYAFTNPPNDPTGWSMQTANLPFDDRRTLQASGPFRLNPQAVNELIIGVPWVADETYPAPSLDRIFRADQLAQGLFDNCFELLDGPDAPNVDWIENNNEVVAVLSNNLISNNYGEGYHQPDFLAPDTLTEEEKNYYFEGYKVIQLANPNVSASEFENPDLARIVYQVDVKNQVTKLFNWENTEGPNSSSGQRYFQPVLAVDGENVGVRHTFPITEDKFATGSNKNLINHKKYYFTVIAYAFNEYAPFDGTVQPPAGQQSPYLVGRRNNKIYTVIPRPIIDQELNAVYGQGVEITRLQGVGMGHTFVELNDASRKSVIDGTFDGTLTYKAGAGPFDVKIFNPFEVKDGEFELSIIDANLTDNKLDENATWVFKKLPDGTPITSERGIKQLNEQIIKEYGFSITVAQTGDAGNRAASIADKALIGAETNGAIGLEYEYADNNLQWMTGFSDQDNGFFNYVKTGKLERDESLDKNQGLTKIGNGWFVPYPLADWSLGAPTDPYLVTPAWTEKYTNTQGILNAAALGNLTERTKKLKALPNIDIVMTSNKDYWSRCVVAEGAPYQYTSGLYGTAPEYTTESPAGKVRQMFDVRYSLSVGKEDANGDGLPDTDGTKDANGADIYGMGWFPGYAIDVETGRRLNVFFSENSALSSANGPTFTGRDMMFNPTSQFVRNPNGINNHVEDVIMGGYHFIYVMNTDYDGCEELRKKFTPDLNTNAGQAKVSQVGKIAWCGMPLMGTSFSMKSYKDGLIPNELRVKIRVDNPYQPWFKFGEITNQTQHPKYTFKIQGSERQALDANQIVNALDSVKVTPNPYYGYSQYETSAFTNIVKITNLPAKCTVSIYSIDGKFIRKYERNEGYLPYQQIAPDVEWDMKNSSSVSVSSGVYLINIDAPGMGKRTIKWFGIARQFDPSRL